jgi:hypothetical protein
MKMYFLRFEVVPMVAEKSEFDGAFVNCWLKRSRKSTALNEAKKLISKEGWKILRLKEESIVTENTYVRGHNGFEYYKQALSDNEVLVFHTWPSRRN